jgi:hypothetical protein
MMAMKLDQILAEALALPVDERERVAAKLLASLPSSI